MRNRLFQSRMTLLALAAMLLLALLPTLGRLAQAGQGAAADAWTQLCTVSGMKLVKLPMSFGHPDAPAPDQGGSGADCDYCPLLGNLVATVAALLLVALGFASPASAPLRAAAPRRSPYPSGLGSRGPPAFSGIAP